MATKFEKLMRGIVETRSSWDSVFLRNVGRDQQDYRVMDDPYKKSDLVYTCVSTTGRAISQVPLLRYEQRGRDEYEPVYSDDPWQALIDRPNPTMDSYKFKEAIASYYMLEGNVCVVPFPPVSMGGKGGVPEALYVVSIKYMTPVRNKTTGQLDGWIYRPNGDGKDSYLLSANEVMHFATWNPSDPVIGQAPIEAGGIHVKVDYKAAVFNEKFFDNAAVPAGMITTPPGVGYGDKKKERLKADLESMHTGYQKAFRLMFLEKGLKYEKIGSTHQEMMFKDLRFMSRESIMQAFGMKKAVISVTDDLNYATAEAQKSAWWEDTIIPILTMIADGFTHYLMGPEAAKILRRKRLLVSGHGMQKGLHLFQKELAALRARAAPVIPQSYFDFDTSGVKALQEDFDKKVETATKLARIGFTANELNQRMGLGFDEDKPWRDYYWTSRVFMPVGGDDFDPDNFFQQPNFPLEEEELAPEPVEPEEEEEDIHVDGAAPPSTPDAGGKMALRGSGQATKAEGRQDRYLRKLSPVENKYQGKVERFFWEIRKKSLRHLLKFHDPAGLMQEEFADETRNFAKWVTPIYREALAVGMRSASEDVVDTLADLDEKRRGMKKGMKTTFSIDIDFLMDNDPEVLSYLMERVDRVGVGKRREGQLTETVRRQIVAELHEGQAKAEGIAELADRIKNKLKGDVSRAKTVARTETISAANYGRNLTFKRSGFTKKEWITAGDPMVRPTHAAMSGKKVGMTEAWVVGGCSLQHPSDYNAGCPAEIINCRCTETIDPDSHPAFQEDPDMGASGNEASVETVPLGESIGDRLQFDDVADEGWPSSAAKRGKRVSAIIDKIHGDGPLKPITVTGCVPGDTAAGRYTYASESIRLNFRNYGSSAESSLAHEIGHWLDNTAFIGKTENARFTPMSMNLTQKSPLLNVLKMARGTDFYKRLSASASTGEFVSVASGKPVSVAGCEDYLGYLLRNEEVWARSYAQYIAKKSGDKELLRQIGEKAENGSWGWGYWTDSDFEPVYEAIEMMFKNLGWMK